MLRMKAVAERMGDDFVCEYAQMPCVSQAMDAVKSADRVEESRLAHGVLR